MPILVIAIVVIAAIGAGAYFFAPQQKIDDVTDTYPEVARPESEQDMAEAEIKAEPTPSPEPTLDATPTTKTEVDITADTVLPTDEDTVTEPEPATVSTLAPQPGPEPVASATDFDNGSFTAAVTYLTPARSTLSMDVTLTLADDKVTTASIIYDNGDGPSNSHQRRFDAAYQAEVVGRSLADIALSRVAGASLTTDSFNEAVAAVAEQARS